LDLTKKINYKEIEVLPEDISVWRKYAVAVLEHAKYKGDTQIKAGKIIEKALTGWDRCPNDFEDRVKILLGHQLVRAYEAGEEYENPLTADSRKQGKKGGKKPKTKEDRFYEEAGITSEVGIDPMDLFTPAVLSSEEIAYLKQREGEYRAEFDFNKSSDTVLLNQVLADELMLRRVSLNRLKGQKVSEADINRTVERIRGNLKELGVTRAQRMELDQDIQGNVGQLSVELDKTLSQIDRLRNKEKRTKVLKRLSRELSYSSLEEIQNFIEELELQRIHNIEYPSNRVSDASS
jgi:hypothetical protein